MRSAPKVKTAKQIERHFKGVANHWRLRILLLLDKQPSLNLLEITEILGGNMKTISEHTRKLAQAGLVSKKYNGAFVLHNLSLYGERFVRFIKTF